MADIAALPTQESLESPYKESRISKKLTGLVGYIRDQFDRARRHKETSVTPRLIKCLLAFKSEYSQEKLEQIRAIGGSEIFIPLTNIKVRAGKAWLTDAFFQPNEKMFSLRPTPIPSLPEEEDKKLRDEIQENIGSLVQSAMKLSALTGGMVDVSVVDSVIEKEKERLREEFQSRLHERAARLCKIEEDRINDQFIEGGFYTEFSKLLMDILLYPTAVMKGVVLRRQRRFVSTSKEVVDIVVPTYNRVSPFDIYPAPEASSISDGFLIEMLHLTPQALREMVGVEGYFDDAILDILERHSSGGLKEWTSMDTERRLLEGKVSQTDDYTIDILEFWGSVEGKLLKDWDINVPDETAFYDVCAWVVDNRILKLILNPDPLGQKPYVKASFVEVPDSFWGISLPEILEPIQSAINALARAAINNAVISSGALIERNIDRLGPDSPKQIIPFQIFDVHESALNSAPAYRFYQLQPTSAITAQLMALFQKMADEYSGIPAYAHGDITVGGAGRTASGLSMLQSHAIRGIKEVVKNIDDGIIEPLVRMQYYFNLYNFITDMSVVPDLSIEARGSVNLLEREAQTTRMLEFLQITSNPVDSQLLGPSGRQFLLESIARNAGIDVSRLFSGMQQAQLQELQQLMTPMLSQQNMQLKKPDESVQLSKDAAQKGSEVNLFARENGR